METFFFFFFFFFVVVDYKEGIFVCTHCGIVQDTVYIPETYNDHSVIMNVYELNDGFDQMLSRMVYSLGFDENMESLIKQYAYDYKFLNKIHKLPKLKYLICALLIHNTSQRHFNSYCSHFNLNSRILYNHLKNVNEIFIKDENKRFYAVEEHVIHICSSLNIPLHKIPRINKTICDLHYGENIIAAALVSFYAKQKVSTVKVLMNISSTSIYKCIKQINNI